MEPFCEIPQSTLENWQSIADILAEIIGIPAALIMRLVDEDIEVFVASRSDGNPYHPGDSEHFEGSGLYCEQVIKSRDKLLVPNALKDEHWKNNPDIKLNMISYLGFPLTFPDDTPFGTICVLDNCENSYSGLYETLMIQMQRMIMSHLELIYMNRELQSGHGSVSEYVSEIKSLRDIIPICADCKRIRNDDGYWVQVEKYFSHYTHSQFSHGICPECLKKYLNQVKDD